MKLIKVFISAVTAIAIGAVIWLIVRDVNYDKWYGKDEVVEPVVEVVDTLTVDTVDTLTVDTLHNYIDTITIK
jgi:hypothetical protein